MFDLPTGITLVTLAFTAWNKWDSNKMGKVIAELQLNLRKEFNGRYITITQAAVMTDKAEGEHEAFKERLDRLERHEDAAR